MKTSKTIYKKVAFDMSFVQITWMAWFVAIVFISYQVLKLINGDVEVNGQIINEQSFLSVLFRPSKIALLIVGIVSSSSFLTFYAKQGITRKDYFIGGAISSVIISFLLMSVGGILSFIDGLFTETTTNTFLGAEASILLVVFVFSINILIYYLVGWLIGAGFYRESGLGFLYIVIGILSIIISDVIWEFELRNPIMSLMGVDDNFEFPLITSFVVSLGLMCALLVIVRATTKRIRIKLK